MRARIPGYHPKLARTCHRPSRGCGRVSQSLNHGAAGAQETEDSGLAETGPKKAKSGPPNIPRARNATAAPRRFRVGWYAFVLIYGVATSPYQRVTVSVHRSIRAISHRSMGSINGLVRAVVQVIRCSMSCSESVTRMPVIDSRSRRTRRWHRQALLLPAGPNRRARVRLWPTKRTSASSPASRPSR